MGLCPNQFKCSFPPSTETKKNKASTQNLETILLSTKKNREANTKCTIAFIDHLEESRNLSYLEFNLRKLLIKILQRLIKERVAYWRQRSKIKFAIEGDENTKYFHAIASTKYRKNKIHTLQHDGSDYSSHHHKMNILTAFFKQLLGQPFIPNWSFSLQHLYPQTVTNLSSLALPFSQEEITDAFFQMNSFASPGPDGFGPSFYKKYWQSIKSDIFQLFNQFHNQSADLSSINRAFIVLLPKNRCCQLT
jgi:hypothetical protein